MEPISGLDTILCIAFVLLLGLWYLVVQFQNAKPMPEDKPCEYAINNSGFLAKVKKKSNEK